jgi:hypothetical protein
MRFEAKQLPAETTLSFKSKSDSPFSDPNKSSARKFLETDRDQKAEFD